MRLQEIRNVKISDMRIIPCCGYIALKKILGQRQCFQQLSAEIFCSDMAVGSGERGTAMNFPQLANHGGVSQNFNTCLILSHSFLLSYHSKIRKLF